MVSEPPSADETRTLDESSADGYALLISSSSAVKAVRIPEGSAVRIGRAPSCDIVVVDNSVSREHARLQLGDRITIEDLGSKNGLRVAGERAPPRTPIPVGVGSVFELGSVTFVLQRPSSIPMATGSIRPSQNWTLPGVVVEDPTMRRLYALLDLAARSTIAVLILGETGVGKEVFAKAIHDKSPRARAAFVPIHCAAMPESMLEAELFGFERGAFTGASQAKPGLFETADGGTVFLDEVGEIPLATQAKLLRVLEAGEVRRLGSVKSKPVDVRVLAATHRDLRALIGDNRFRADVYFRLNGITITLPPLRERKLDITPLARAFGARAAAAMNKEAPELTADAVGFLEGYAWPGNVRELRNVIERAVLLGGAVLSRVDLERAAPEVFASGFWPSTATTGADPQPAPSSSIDAPALRERLKELERKELEDVLARAGGNQSRAAKTLGISRYALMYRMDSFGLVRPRKKR
jgi:transcriptional regulator with PAS, ATPase and Fis domain